MNKLITISIALLIALSVAGCATVPKRDVGLGVGALAGGVAGSALTGGSGWGTAIGAVGGGVAGYHVGKTYERR
jgi:osmotically inducible lipoprotein OsmB